MDDSNLVKEINQPLYEKRGWIKFLGILQIISGVLSCLSIIGLIYGWLPIWMGALLTKAGSNTETAQYTGDKFQFMESLSSLKLYFTIQGVLIIIGLLSLIITLSLVLAALWGGSIALQEIMSKTKLPIF